MEPNPLPPQNLPPAEPPSETPQPAQPSSPGVIQPEPPAPIQPTPETTPKPPADGGPQVIQPVFANSSSDRPIGVAGATPVEPAVIGGQVIGFNDQEISKPSKKFLSKKLAIIAAGVFVLFGGSAAAYFGYYVPNKPENVWKTALSRTGKGYDQLTSYAVSQFKTKNSGLKLDGSFKTSGFIAADGTFSGSSDKNNGEYTGSLSTGGVKVGIDVRLLKSATSTPDIYFKVDGIQGLGDLVGNFAGPQYAKAINGLNGKWYFIDHSLFDQFSGGNGNSFQITADDVNSVLSAIGKASEQNVFTTDPQKMAFTIQKQVGKEKKDNRNTYHYVAGINKDNLKAYVQALCDNLKNSSLKKFYNGDSQQVSDSLGCSTATTAINNFDTSRTADVWVDLHTKLIHSIRITDKTNSKNYWEIGQDYQGGSKYPFWMKFHSQDQSSTNDSSINLTLDTKASSLSLAASSKDSGSDNFSGSVQLTVSPNSGTVNVQKPANAETIIQLLNDLGFADIVNGQIQSQAADTERKTDINALQGQIEAYWADNGYYPTLANLNDSAWLAQNMKGLDTAALQDPAGASAKLAASPAAHVYSYQPLPAGCNNTTVQCNDFTLTATLDDGSTYVKQSLNSTTSAPVYQN